MKRYLSRVIIFVSTTFSLCGCVNFIGSPGGGGASIEITSPQWYQDRQQKKDGRNMVSALHEEKLQFTCVNEADNHPPLDPEADSWFKQARALEKATGPKDYEAIGALYRKAIARDHYKAMRNLQNLLMDGLVKPLPGKTAPQEAVDIVERMIALNIPAGYYAMGYYLEMGYGVEQDKSASIVYFRKSADLGSPEGQYKIGDILLSKLLPGVGDNPAYYPDVGMKMLNCSVNQGYAEAGARLGGFYRRVNKDYNMALKYYQLAVKNGHMISAMRLKASFDNPSELEEVDYLALIKDPERVRRYGLIEDEIDRNPAARFPDLDKIVPLPPAELPAWDGTFEYKKAQQ